MTDRLVTDRLGRRAWLIGGLGVGASLALGCASESGRPSQIAPRTSPAGYGRPKALEPVSQSAAYGKPSAPQCSAAPTTKDIEGPFFKAGAPRGAEIGHGIHGHTFALRGRVAGIDCAPRSRASLEIWQADPVGRYDNEGFSFRTTVVTDESGAFELRSVVPGHYKNGDQFRPAHVHVKVHHPDHPTLTTQLYFEGDPYNDIDPWFDRSRALKLVDESGMHTAHFDFVLG